MNLPRLVRWICWIGLIFLVLFTLLRFGHFLSFSREHSFGQVTDAFFLGLRYDLRMVSILMLVMLVLGSIRPLHPFRSRGARIGWFTVLWIVTVVTLFFFVADFAHYAYLAQRLNASVLNYLDDAAISMSMVWQTYPVIRLLLAIVATATIIMWIIRFSYRRINKLKVQRSSRRTTTISFIVMFLVTAFFIVGRIGQYPIRWSDAFGLGDDYKANLAFNPYQSFFSSLKFRHDGYDLKKLEKLYPVLKPYYPFVRQENNEISFERLVQPVDSSAPMNQPNIVLVICESFSMYKSSMSGNPLNTTPFFDSLCRNGIYFDRCFTPTYGTARGVWATLTGTPDVVLTKTASRNPSAVDQHTILNDFVGYEKFYFLGGSTSWANIRGLLTNNIKDLHLYEEEDYRSPKIDVWGISDKNLFLEANEVLAKQTQPFFAVIQTAGNHRPYTIPDEDQKEFKKLDLPQDSLRKYGFETLAEFNAFRYTDFTFKKFMEAAGRENYSKNTIFVFIGDHGIPGNAHNLYPSAWTDQRLTMEHVPLLYYSPALKPRTVHTISSQVDVLPTLAGLCNIPYTNSTLGRNMLDSTAQGLAFIFDPDNKMAGVIKGDYFYRKRINGSDDDMVPINNNLERAIPDSARQEMLMLTEALYESSRYLLFNNKKKFHVQQ